MQGEDVLLTIAEIAIAFAGFSGIVVVFSRREGQWTGADRVAFWEMISSSLMILMLALLPFLFHHAGLRHPAVWGWCSGLAAAAFVVRGLHSVSNAARAGAFRAGNLFSVGTAFLVGGVLIAIGLICNAAGLVFERIFAPYLAALLFYLLVGCFSFWNLLTARIPP